jgi:toxin YoeB
MKLAFTAQGWADYDYWRINDWSTADHVNRLLKACLEDPFAGIGRPVPLIYDLSSYHARRIDRYHRLVYRVAGDTLTIIQCRYHY